MAKLKLKSFITAYQSNTGWRRLFFVIVTGLFFFLLLFLNIKTPMSGDDYTYSLIFDTAQKLQSFGDIVTSQITHYQIWGGRIVVHTVSQLLLFADPLLADIINSLAFIALILLMYVHINDNKSLSLSLLIGIFLLVWLMEPFAETILWLTGSANYMWGTTIVLAFLLPYRIYEGKKKRKALVAALQTVVMFLFAVVAGCTNENTAAGMLLMCVLFLVYHRMEKRQIPLWAYAGLAGAIAGYIFMITAPGNTVRAQGTETGLFTVMYNTVWHTKVFLNMLGLFNAIVVAFAVYLYKSDNVKYRPVLCLLFIYAVGILVSIYVMTLAPFFPTRAWFGIITFNIIALGLLVVNMEIRFLRYVKYGFVALGLLVFLFNSYDVYKDVNQVEQQLKKREQIINAGIEAHKDTIIIPLYYTYTKYALRDAEYAAPLLSRYYGVEIEFE
jgi:hypothetical protein